MHVTDPTGLHVDDAFDGLENLLVLSHYSQSTALRQPCGAAAPLPTRLVVPAAYDMAALAQRTYRVRHANSTEHPARSRMLVFFGSFRLEDLSYSRGFRQRAFISLHSRPGFAVEQVAPLDDYFDALRSSVFCLAASGNGFDSRLANAMAAGCIPVLVDDRLVLPLQGELPYHKFSLRVADAHFDDLEAVLAAVPLAEVRRLQHGVRRFHRHFYWDGDGLALNSTLRALQAHAARVQAAWMAV